MSWPLSVGDSRFGEAELLPTLGSEKVCWASVYSGRSRWTSCVEGGQLGKRNTESTESREDQIATPCSRLDSLRLPLGEWSHAPHALLFPTRDEFHSRRSDFCLDSAFQEVKPRRARKPDPNGDRVYSLGAEPGLAGNCEKKNEGASWSPFFVA
jgi:hypothetical protein